MYVSKKMVLSLTQILLINLPYVWCISCNLLDTCSCDMSDGSGTIDLTSLGNTDDTPRFLDVQENGGGDTYISYNPCGGFEEGDCSDAAACLVNADKSEQRQIGDTASAAFVYNTDTDNVLAIYTSSRSLAEMVSVNLVCDQSACDPIFESEGVAGVQSYQTQLTTVCACPGMCTASGPISCGATSGASMSAGTILIIAFVGILPVYVIVGVTYMKVRRKATGTDLIPNKDMWISLPGLVLSGVKFIFSKCKKRSGYDNI